MIEEARAQGAGWTRPAVVLFGVALVAPTVLQAVIGLSITGDSAGSVVARRTYWSTPVLANLLAAVPLIVVGAAYLRTPERLRVMYWLMPLHASALAAGYGLSLAARANIPTSGDAPWSWTAWMFGGLYALAATALVAARPPRVPRPPRDMTVSPIRPSMSTRVTVATCFPVLMIPVALAVNRAARSGFPEIPGAMAIMWSYPVHLALVSAAVLVFAIAYLRMPEIYGVGYWLLPLYFFAAGISAVPELVLRTVGLPGDFGMPIDWQSVITSLAFLATAVFLVVARPRMEQAESAFAPV